MKCDVCPETDTIRVRIDDESDFRLKVETCAEDEATIFFKSSYKTMKLARKILRIAEEMRRRGK